MQVLKHWTISFFRTRIVKNGFQISKNGVIFLFLPLNLLELCLQDGLVGGESIQSAFNFSEEGSLASPAFLISLAAASNKMISLSTPRRNFSLSFDALYRS